MNMAHPYDETLKAKTKVGNPVSGFNKRGRLLLSLTFILSMINVLFVLPEGRDGLNVSRRKVGPSLVPCQRGVHTGDVNRFLVFGNMGMGQGHGNVISGLLAAHLLGLEFNRIVCVSRSYDGFYDAFEPIDKDALQYCPEILQEANDGQGRTLDIIQIVDFMSPPNECWLREKMMSNANILYLMGNTYPRWPTVPNNFFFQYYAAHKRLLDALPYDKNPETVVHLRSPDNEKDDTREGLDEESFQALGDLLPGDTYLVTNRVEWYKRFREEFGWSHSPWDEPITHSALDLAWGKSGKVAAKEGARQTSKGDAHLTGARKQNLRMMADWYTILKASKVYHTRSAFSQSAIHWMNIDSKRINGTESGRLSFVDEDWRASGETTRLADRTKDGTGQSALKFCHKSVMSVYQTSA
jgi:hypothetical protein